VARLDALIRTVDRAQYPRMEKAQQAAAYSVPYAVRGAGKWQ